MHLLLSTNQRHSPQFSTVLSAYGHLDGYFTWTTREALQEIVGQKKIIPIYDMVQNNGDKTDYTIVGFAGVRLMRVSLSGGHKGVVVQKTNVMSKYALVDTSLNLANDLVYTTPRLVR